MKKKEALSGYLGSGVSNTSFRLAATSIQEVAVFNRQCLFALILDLRCKENVLQNMGRSL
jgi:hypothetical protein